MSNTIIKKIEIQHPTANIEVDIGAEAQSITVSRNASGEIITDLDTEIVDSTETLAETLKEGESPFTGATASANGTKGLVPQPVAGDENKCLFGDATWRESISGSSITITSLEASLNGKQVSISDGTHTKTGTFNSSGICTITGITFVGNLTITSTDGTKTATKIVNMPYFGVYATTLSFWAATINITGSDELKGALVTVKNSSDITVGTVTLSSTDATGVFVASEADTYKFNFTYDGKNYSEELEVTTQTTYNLSLSVGFDWQTWLEEGRVSKTFSSLDDILEDEETLRQLMLVHNSVDYICNTFSESIISILADITKIFNTDLAAKWINLSDYAFDHFYAVADIKSIMDEADKYGYGEWVIVDDTTTPPTWAPKGAVPKMTSNTAPYGEASASTAYDTGYLAWNAFDKNNSTYWCTASNSVSNQYLGYKFTNPVNVKKVVLTNLDISGNATKVAKNCKLQYSNDGSTYQDVPNGSFVNDNTKIVNEFEFDTDIYALGWRVFITDDWGDSQYIYIKSLQFYGRQLSVSVPVMTSNTAPFGEASASSNTVSGRTFTAFNDTGTPWSTNSNSVGGYTAYKFTHKVKIQKAYVNFYNEYSKVFTFKLQGSNTGDTNDWHDLATVTSLSQSSTSEKHWIDINTNSEYLYYRIYNESDILINQGAYNLSVLRIQFYGLDYSEKEFEAGTNKKWLYDHGIELETFNTNASVTKGDNELTLTTNGSQADVSIDLTDYNLARCKVGSHMSGTSAIFVGTVASANLTTANAPNNESLDVSAINQTLLIGVKMAANGTCDIAELWLEP